MIRSLASFYLLLLFTTTLLGQQQRHSIDLAKSNGFQRYNIGHTGESYTKMLNFREGLILIYIDARKLYAYMDAQSNVIIPYQYDQYCSFYEGRARVRKGNKWGYINPEMELVIPFRYEEASDFIGGEAVVRMGKYYRFIDSIGKVLPN